MSRPSSGVKDDLPDSFWRLYDIDTDKKKGTAMVITENTKREYEMPTLTLVENGDVDVLTASDWTGEWDFEF